MEIDLHGLTENEAFLKLDGFLLNFKNSFNKSCKIITGKGIVLRPMVIDHLEQGDFKWKNEANNDGAIIVYK